MKMGKNFVFSLWFCSPYDFVRIRGFNILLLVTYKSHGFQGGKEGRPFGFISAESFWFSWSTQTIAYVGGYGGTLPPNSVPNCIERASSLNDFDSKVLFHGTTKSASLKLKNSLCPGDLAILFVYIWSYQDFRISYILFWCRWYCMVL